jgi:hypothetical protein
MVTVFERSAVVYVPPAGEPVSALTKMLDPGMLGGPTGSLDPVPKSETYATFVDVVACAAGAKLKTASVSSVPRSSMRRYLRCSLAGKSTSSPHLEFPPVSEQRAEKPPANASHLCRSVDFMFAPSAASLLAVDASATLAKVVQQDESWTLFPRYERVKAHNPAVSTGVLLLSARVKSDPSSTEATAHGLAVWLQERPRFQGLSESG